MTLKEALDSSSRFRRKSGGEDYYPAVAGNRDNPHLFNVAEVLADDWELEQDELNITESNLVKAMHSMRYLVVDSVEAYASELFRRLKE